jgi:coproporphyrinogen III oxidase
MYGMSQAGSQLKQNLAMQAKMKKMLEEAQAFICKSIEDVDGGAKFRLDHWTRENGDVGVTAVMADGKVLAAT